MLIGPYNTEAFDFRSDRPDPSEVAKFTTFSLCGIPVFDVLIWPLLPYLNASQS